MEAPNVGYSVKSRPSSRDKVESADDQSVRLRLLQLVRWTKSRSNGGAFGA
jgi:hypothetical protein